MLYDNLVSSDFVNKVQQISDALGINPDWLMYIIHNETAGTFSPSEKNPNSTATGLIQFLEMTAQALGTSTAALSQMTAVDQLDYVKLYFQNVIQLYGSINSVSDCYLAVFYPAAIAWGEAQRFSNTVYTANKIFDIDKLGYLSKQDFENYVNYHYSLVNDGTTDSNIDAIPASELTELQKNNLVIYVGCGMIVILCIVLIYLFKTTKTKTV